MPRLSMLACVAIPLLAACSGSSAPSASSAGDGPGWIGSWAAAPYGPYPLGPLTDIVNTEGVPVPPLPVFNRDQAENQSFRMIVHPTLAGPAVRVRLSNLEGSKAITFDDVQVATVLLGPAIQAATARAVSFGGGKTVTVAPGAEAISDPVSFGVALGDDVAISFYVAGDSGPITWHAISFYLSYVGLPNGGDTATDATGLSFIQPSIGWFFVSGLDVLRPDALGSVVAFGDSITDGAFELPETNTRWPDWFARRLQQANIPMGVLNEGINDNTVFGGEPDGSGGPPAVARFARDALARPGVRSVFILEGTNDLQIDDATADTVYAGLQQLAAMAHANGLCFVVSTILPRSDVQDDLVYKWDPATMEPQRLRLNQLILASTDFDATADLAGVMASPLDASQPNPVYFFADGLHPNSLGYKVMADNIPIAPLVPPPLGTCQR